MQPAASFQAAGGSWLSTPRLLNSSTSRLLDPVLCFHRHSRFVRSTTADGALTIPAPQEPVGNGGQGATPGLAVECGFGRFLRGAPHNPLSS